MSATTVEDRTLDGPHGPLRVRLYTPEAPTGPGLVWAHGGGFAAGDLDMPEADWVSRQFAARGIPVVSIDYALAPVPAGWEAPAHTVDRPRVHYPIASEEVAFAFAWAVDAGIAPGPWSLGGASAGAGLATGSILRLLHGDGPRPALAVLAYPTLHAVQDEHSAELQDLLRAHPEHAGFTPEAIRGMYENYLGGPVDDAEVYAIPGTATVAQLAGFPPAVIVNDELDALRTSGEAFARVLADAGTDVDISTAPGESHGHLNRADSAAIASIDRFAARILSRHS